MTTVLHLPAIDIYGFKGIVLVFTLQLFPSGRDIIGPVINVKFFLRKGGGGKKSQHQAEGFKRFYKQIFQFIVLQS